MMIELTFKELIEEAKRLPLVPLNSAMQYHEFSGVMKEEVDNMLIEHPSIHKLIGGNPIQIMLDNHKHHASFMGTVFNVGNYELLARTVPWVYRAYHGHHFSYDYFLHELDAWSSVIQKHMPKNSKEIRTIYHWMIKNHQNMIRFSENEVSLPLSIDNDWVTIKNQFLGALLEGDHQHCLEITNKLIKSPDDVESLYLQVIQPVMYEVGMLWERGEISVAEEHLASAIIGRVIANINLIEISSDKKKGKVVVAAAPNEYHEIGAWIIADIMEKEGWTVKYLGANTPSEGLHELLYSFSPDIVAFSVTMPFNILEVKRIIQEIRQDGRLNRIRILVGGRAFYETPDLWKAVGADAFAVNGHDLKDLLKEWEKNE